MIAIALNFKIDMTGFAAGGVPGPPGGGPPGQSKGTTVTTVEGGGGIGAARVIGIYPQFPIDEQILKNGDYFLTVKITYGGSPTSESIVTLDSSLFGFIYLYYQGGITGVYGANISIKDVQEGKYKILYKVADKENEEGSIFVNINPNLIIETRLSSNYSKGEMIEFKGVVKDFYNNPQPNVNLSIKGYYKGKLFEKSLSTDDNGDFHDDYLISYADPAGIWNITISARDKYGNKGIISFNPEIKSSGISYYAVNFLSPFVDSVFKRGEYIPISVEVREKNEIVEHAKVMYISPRGEGFALEEIGNGIYSSHYIIRNNDPTGEIRLKVQAIKEIDGFVKTGGDSIPISINPVEINFNVISPLSNIAYTNSRLKFVVKLSYADGSLVEGANVKLDLSNGKTINLLEDRTGVYSGSYLVGKEDAGTLILKTIAEDINENIGSIESLVYTRQRGLIGNLLALFYENVIKKFWWAFLTIFIATIIFYKETWNINYLHYAISKTKKEQKNIIAMQIESERKYYKEGSISKSEFEQLKQQYEMRLAKESEKQNDYERRLAELKK